MTFPRVHHADYFSDSGPVDGTVLVNSHSDAIEALQATVTLVADQSTVNATTGTDGQIAVVTDSIPINGALVVWFMGSWVPIAQVFEPLVETAAWVAGNAPVADAQAVFVSDATTPGAYAIKVGSGGVWQDVHAIDQTARDNFTNIAGAVSALAPTIASGNPTTAGAPLDNTVLYYFDSSTSPYTMWVFDGAAFQQVQ